MAIALIQISTPVSAIPLDSDSTENWTRESVWEMQERDKLWIIDIVIWHDKVKGHKTFKKKKKLCV